MWAPALGVADTHKKRMDPPFVDLQWWKIKQTISRKPKRPISKAVLSEGDLCNQGKIKQGLEWGWFGLRDQEGSVRRSLSLGSLMQKQRRTFIHLQE